MSSSSSVAVDVEGLAARLCSICLNTVVDDNSRGKAELVCGHLFHLDCIGSEFNYRSEMKCPNCRVVENGEWLMPDEDLDDDDDYSVHLVNNRRLELHIYSHGGRSNSPTSRGQNGDQEARLPMPMVSPTVHYHHNTVVLPPTYGGSASLAYTNDSLNADSLLRAYGAQQVPNPTRSTRVEHVTPDRFPRPNVGEVRPQYQRTRYHHNSPTPPTMNNASMHQIRGENTTVHANTRRFDMFTPREYHDHNPSLELTLTTNPSEDRSQEEQRDANEGQSANDQTDESYWFQVRE